jgi:hypothetical protein
VTRSYVILDEAPLVEVIDGEIVVTGEAFNASFSSAAATELLLALERAVDEAERAAAGS